MAPASRLDARDRERNRRRLRDEHGQVDDPVLLGADQFFAVDDQHRTLAVVDDAELGDAASGGDLGDVQRAGANRVGERVVKRRAAWRTQQRIDGERVDRGWRSDGERRQERVKIVHAITSASSRKPRESGSTASRAAATLQLTIGLYISDFKKYRRKPASPLPAPPPPGEHA